MYQVNVVYNKDILEIVFNCLTFDAASKVRYSKIKKWFDKKMFEGADPAEIFDLLQVEIVEQDG